MSGTAKEAERAQELRRRAKAGDEAAKAELSRGENTPPAPHTEEKAPTPRAQ